MSHITCVLHPLTVPSGILEVIKLELGTQDLTEAEKLSVACQEETSMIQLTH